MFTTICVGFDGSEPSENALRMACYIADKYDASVHVIHTPHPETVALALGSVAGDEMTAALPTPDEVKRATERTLDRARSIATKANSMHITTQVGEGETAHAIVSHAKRCGADLIVTGRRGVGNVHALVLGSTSQSVAQLADCAHLTVK